MVAQPNDPQRDTPPTTDRDSIRAMASAASPVSTLVLALKASRNDCSCEICKYLREFADQLARIPLGSLGGP